MPACSDNVTVDEGFDVLDYNYDSHIPVRNDISIRGERNLWCAVIVQAFDDLDHKEEGREARRWLLHDKKDFPFVCFLAGVSPVTVRKAALKRSESVSLRKKILPEPV